MKKRFSLMLSLLFVLSLCSCTGTKRIQASPVSRGDSAASVSTMSSPTASTSAAVSSQAAQSSGAGASSQTATASETSVSSAQLSSTATYPEGKPIGMLTVSSGAAGMYLFYCFNGSVYKIVGTNDVSRYKNTSPEQVMGYDRSEVSEKPIGYAYSPLSPGATDTNPVYGVNGELITKGMINVLLDIAIRMGGPGGYFYCRAHYIASDSFSFQGKTYCIAPVSVVGMITQKSWEPYLPDKKIGTAGGFDIYSLKHPARSGELAVDVPGMALDMGSFKIYPLAVPQ